MGRSAQRFGSRSRNDYDPRRSPRTADRVAGESGHHRSGPGKTRPPTVGKPRFPGLARRLLDGAGVSPQPGRRRLPSGICGAAHRPGTMLSGSPRPAGSGSTERGGCSKFARLSLEDRSVRRGPLLLSPELCAIVRAFRGYPTDPRWYGIRKGNRGHALRPLRRYTGIRVTRAQREALWPKQGRGRLDHRRQPDAKAGTPEEDGTVETH